MPSDRTTVTELGTGLGMLGLSGIDDAVRSRTPVMHSLSPEMWERLARLRAGGAYDAEFHAAWANGQAFLAAADGLRGRLPKVVEWKGTGRAPGDEVAPIDLRVDHVYLVSCKYLSKILFNVSPSHVFDSLLIAGQSRGSRMAREVLPGGGDWYAEVAPAEYQGLYEAVRLAAAQQENVASTPAVRRGRAAPPPPSRSPGWPTVMCSPTTTRRPKVPRTRHVPVHRPGSCGTSRSALSISRPSSATRWVSGSGPAGLRAPRTSMPTSRTR
ncbi:MAG: hypothetical protein ABSE98_13870 [Acidimicrobiales bacterium]